MKAKFPKKTIYLIRHGQTQGNREGNWLGARSVDKLSEYGKKQARYTARYLKEKNIDASKIFSSPAARALEHAEILQKRLDLPIEKLNSLSEINLGILEDRTREQGLRLVSEEIHDWKTNLTRFEPPLGESAVEAAERFYEIVELISQNYTKPDLIFVSHGVVIKLFLARILDASLKTGETKIRVPWTTHGTITLATYSKRGFKFRKVIPNKYPDSKKVAAFG
jgi:uncharacterized phosphatase